MITPAKISGILFDLDNTLIATEELCGRLLSDILLLYNVKLRNDEKRWMVGKSWKSITDHVIEPKKLPISSEVILNRILDKKNSIITKTKPFLPGAKTAVRQLADKYPVGIVSGSFRREIEFIIDLMEISDRIQVMVGAEDVTHGKPDPEPYLTGATKLDLDPGHVLVFEDSESGVTSAKRAGCFCVAVKVCAIPECDFSQADSIINTLECVDPHFVEALNV